MATHFRAIASRYRSLRELDASTVHRVSSELEQLAEEPNRLVILDVGTGTGRYAEAVVHEVSKRAGRHYHGVAFDAIPEMLRGGRLHHPGDSDGVVGAIGVAEFLPFATQSLGAVLSFNALHHFDLPRFLAEAARVVRPGGRLILYTRTPEQNQRTIWGQLFPHFAERETRLYAESTLRAALGTIPEFESIELCEMPWTICTSLTRLLEQARNGGYSTFRFYSPDEFEEALGTFESRVRSTFDDPTAIAAQNDHQLVLAVRR